MSDSGSSRGSGALLSCAVTRRAALQTIIGAGLGMTLGGWESIAEGSGLDQLLGYLERHARPDGGYGWAGQSRSHLTPSFAVAGAYHILGRQPPRKTDLARFIRTHHPSELKKLEQEHREFDYQQIQSLVWLGEDVSDFRQRVRTWTRPTVYLKQYEQQSLPILRHEMTAFTCRALLGMEVGDLEVYLAYLDARRRSNGSFNNTPADDKSDGHVMNTLWGLQALQVARGEIANREPTAAWVEGCRLPNGGFTWQPNAPFAGNDDVAYTWAAVCCMELLGAKPARLNECRDYIASLRGSDGGFADRPGWNSNPMATYYALDTLRRLGSLSPLDEKAAKPRARRRRVPRGLRIYTIQIEAHGKGSPAEAVDLAGALRIHLWGAKNATPEWLARAQDIATRTNVPVTFLLRTRSMGHGCMCLVWGLTATRAISWLRRRLPSAARSRGKGSYRGLSFATGGWIHCTRGRGGWSGSSGKTRNWFGFFWTTHWTVVATLPSARSISEIPISRTANHSCTGTGAAYHLWRCRTRTGMKRGGFRT